MSENIHLLGAEKVENAMRNFNSSVAEFTRYVGYFSEILHQERTHWEELLRRLEVSLKESRPDIMQMDDEDFACYLERIVKVRNATKTGEPK